MSQPLKFQVMEPTTCVSGSSGDPAAGQWARLATYNFRYAPLARDENLRRSDVSDAPLSNARLATIAVALARDGGMSGEDNLW